MEGFEGAIGADWAMGAEEDAGVEGFEGAIGADWAMGSEGAIGAEGLEGAEKAAIYILLDG